jgi:hypothetical protein
VFKHLFEDVVDFSRRMGYNFDQAFESNTRSGAGARPAVRIDENHGSTKHGTTRTRIDEREAQR